MKKIILFCLICIDSLLCLAQTQQYEVTANTFLNIRSAANNAAPIVATIDKGGTVNVYEINNGWAKIAHAGGYAYVSSAYIRIASPHTVAEADNSFDFNRLFSGSQQDVRWLIYIILSASIILLIIRLKRGEDQPLEGSTHQLNWILLGAAA